MAPIQTYTRDEVAKNTSDDSLWMIIDSKVYDLTDFVDAHPGGPAVLREVAGKDATAEFYNLHRHEVLVKYDDMLIGTVKDETPQVVNPGPGELSKVPYAEPLWLTPAFRNPYYSDSHRRLQRAMREFTDRYITPEALELEVSGEYISQELIERMSAAGINHMRLGPGPHLHGVELLGGAVDGKKFDYFHDLVITQELARSTSNRCSSFFLFFPLLPYSPFPLFRLLRESPSYVCVSHVLAPDIPRLPIHPQRVMTNSACR